MEEQLCHPVRWTAYPFFISVFTLLVSTENKRTFTLHHSLVYVLDCLEGRGWGRTFFGCHASPNPQVPCPFSFLHASNEFSLVPARSTGPDGLVQHGITPAGTVACQTGSHRPGHAKHSHTVLTYGNNVCWELIGSAERAGRVAWFYHKSE